MHRYVFIRTLVSKTVAMPSVSLYQRLLILRNRDKKLSIKFSARGVSMRAIRSLYERLLAVAHTLALVQQISAEILHDCALR